MGVGVSKKQIPLENKVAALIGVLIPPPPPFLQFKELLKCKQHPLLFKELFPPLLFSILSSGTFGDFFVEINADVDINVLFWIGEVGEVVEEVFIVEDVEEVEVEEEEGGEEGNNGVVVIVLDAITIIYL